MSNTPQSSVFPERAASPDSQVTQMYDGDEDGGMTDVPAFTPASRADVKSAMDALQVSDLPPPPRFSSSPSLLAFASHMKRGAEEASAGAAAAAVPPPLVLERAPSVSLSAIQRLQLLQKEKEEKQAPKTVKLADSIEHALHGPLPDAPKDKPRVRNIFRQYAEATLEYSGLRIRFHESRPALDDPAVPLRLLPVPIEERMMGICGHCDQGPTPIEWRCPLCHTMICGPACTGATACASCTRVSGCSGHPSVQNQCNGCSRFFCGVEHRLVACVHDVVGNWCLDCVRNRRLSSYCPCLEEVMGICTHRNVWVAESALVHCDVCGLKCIDPVLNGASAETVQCGEPGCKSIAACSKSRGDQCRVCARALCPTHTFKNQAGEMMCTLCTTKALECYTSGKHRQLNERLGKVKRFRAEIRYLQDQVKDSDAALRAVLPVISADPARADGGGGVDSGLLAEVLRNVQARFDAQQQMLSGMSDVANAALQVLAYCDGGAVAETGTGGAGCDPTPYAPARRV